MSTGREPAVASGIRLALLNGSYLGMSNLYYLLIRGIYVVVFARLLGVELYGYYVYSQSWYILALPIAAWGISELAIAKYSQLERAGKTELLATGFALRLSFGAAMSLVIIAAAMLFETNADLRLLIIIYAQAVLVRGATNWIITLCVAQESSQFQLYLSIPFLTLEVLVAVFLAWRGEGLPVIAVAQCALWWLRLLLTAVVYQRYFGPIRPRFKLHYVRFFLANGASMAAAAFMLSFLGTGLLIVYRYFNDDAQQLGAIAFVVQVVIILGEAVKVISNAALPQLNLPLANQAQRHAFYAETVWKQSLYVGGALYLICFLMLPTMVVTLVGKDFAVAASLFAKYSWLLIPLPIIYGLRLLLISTGQMRDYLLATVLGVSLLLAQVFVLARMDAVSAVNLLVALGISYSGVASLILVMVLRKMASLRWKQLVVAPTILLCSLAVFFFLPGNSRMIPLVLGLLLLLVASYMAFRRSYRTVTNQ